jgi:hypothetical protein
MTNWSIAVRFRHIGSDPDAVLIWDHGGSSRPSFDGIPDSGDAESDPVFREVLRSWQVIRRELGCMGHLLSELDEAAQLAQGDASVSAS